MLNQAKKQTIGACQACLRDFVVKGTTDSVMVLHGYERPGTGYIIGNCPGVGHAPFELSCEFTKSWRNQLVNETLPATKQILSDLKSGKVKTFIATHYESRYGKPIKQFVIEGSANPAPWDKKEPDWKALRASAVRQQESRIDQIETDIVWLTERIRCWVYAPERLLAGYAREPLSREGTIAAAERKFRLNARAAAKADRAAKAKGRREKAESDVAEIVKELKEVLARPEVRDTLLATKGSWFGDINMGQLADQWAHLTELLSRRGLLSVKPGLIWDLNEVMAAQRFEWMKKPEAIRADLREVQKALKKELAGLGIKMKAKVAA